MTKLKALQEQLLSQLATKLNAKGFKRKEQSFYKDIPGGKQIFHIAFIKHVKDFDLTADIAVRHDKLEELVNEFNSIGRSLKKRWPRLQTLNRTNKIGFEEWDFSPPTTPYPL